MTLADLTRNQKAHISVLPNDLELASRLLEQGFAVRTEISLAHKAPWNGPLAFRLHNTKVTIQPKIAQQITVILA
ncbi:MAG: ferrous iron transport protein A [Alteromonadaceae bacterium]|jgi:ferrous iron transport protein A|tara:strand:+ start:3836 stop:4060 length:225 start_codon:yes stop_codon:yes gene_type:complete